MVGFCEDLVQNYYKKRSNIEMLSQIVMERVDQASHVFKSRPDEVWVPGYDVFLDETHSLEEFVACFTTKFALVFLLHVQLYSTGCFPNNVSTYEPGRAPCRMRSLLNRLSSMIPGINIVAIDEEACFLVKGFFPTFVSGGVDARGW